MYRALRSKITESLSSVLPITGIVCAMCFFVVPLRLDALMLFLTGAALLILGMGLFTMGVDLSMSPMGESVGAQLTKNRRLTAMCLIGFLIGFIITVAEPDLQVLATTLESVTSWVLIACVAVGVGVFLVLAMLRILFRIPLNWLLLGFYALLLVLSIFVPDDFVAAAFDSGGVTTGPMTVPFILALGMGVSSARSDGESGNDGFGLVALCSIGPVLAVLLLGFIYKPQPGGYELATLPAIAHTQQLFRTFSGQKMVYIKEVAIALAPVLVFYAIYQHFALRLSGRQRVRISVGVVYTFLGLVIFLLGVNVGFLPAGSYLGEQIASLPFRWIIVPLGMLIGYFIVAAEPAVHVLNKLVEEMTEGAIPARTIQLALSIGVSCSVGLAMIRVLTGLSIYWLLIPGYVVALGLSFVTPKIFTAIAFESGGVASGPMTAAFLLPFAIGACRAVGGNVAQDAFGLVAMVAMTPLIAIQIVGLVYRIRAHSQTAVPETPAIIVSPEAQAPYDEEIIEMDMDMEAPLQEETNA